MRLVAPATVLVSLLLLAGCAAPAPTVTATPKPTPTPTALTEPQQLDKQTKTLVNLYSQVVCTNLADHPDIDLNAAVDKVLATYATTGLSDASRVTLAHRVLEQSAAKSCPDQSARVTEDLGEGVTK